jgi:energy-coupling factor transporter ATP-binding protein EcfA2
VLSALIARKNNENDAFINDCNEKEAQKQPHSHVPKTVIDTLKRIWQNVFPQRDIDFKDSKVTATLTKKDSPTVSYKGNEMSDGERVGLYLIAQCLCIPENKTIIIDEPEIHLHRSIMNRLWTEIENARKDCFFIYITHDTQFAANHKHADKIWVKSFDGTNWELERIAEEGIKLPEQLLLDIMGNRKKVLFVEGTADSYDTKLYSEIYKDYYVVPCGGCTSVIAKTNAMKNTTQLHDIECYGIIDRDYRSEHEIEAIKEHSVFTINVAEVENLFLVEELLSVVNEILFPNDNSRVDKIKRTIIDERYKKQINSQICEAVVSELKYQLSIIEIAKNNEENAKQSLETVYKLISYDKIKGKVEQKFNAANDYKQVLAVFNCKSLSCEVEKEFGKKEYKEFVVGQLFGDKAEEIKKAIVPYLPIEIQRT